jgi:hypothetical protein
MFGAILRNARRYDLKAIMQFVLLSLVILPGLGHEDAFIHRPGKDETGI